MYFCEVNRRNERADCMLQYFVLITLLFLLAGCNAAPTPPPTPSAVLVDRVFVPADGTVISVETRSDAGVSMQLFCVIAHGTYQYASNPTRMAKTCRQQDETGEWQPIPNLLFNDDSTNVCIYMHPRSPESDVYSGAFNMRPTTTFEIFDTYGEDDQGGLNVTIYRLPVTINSDKACETLPP